MGTLAKSTQREMRRTKSLLVSGARCDTDGGRQLWVSSLTRKRRHPQGRIALIGFKS